MAEVFHLEPRGGPLILSMPHVGVELIEGLEARLSAAGKALGDTDWRVDRLYDFAGDLDATVIKARLNRLVVDLNRDPSGQSLYPGQATTGLCPETTFDGEPLYLEGEAPDADEVAERAARYHAPYHEALAAEIARVKAKHGYALLFDCHSIRSVVPRLFDGELPVFNLGTNDGQSCAPALSRAAAETVGAAEGFSHVLDGRFKGGWITRRYGDPAGGVHAIQMELAQRVYMEEQPPYRYREDLAQAVKPHLRRLLERLIETATSL
jgi:formiminoglutamase